MNNDEYELKQLDSDIMLLERQLKLKQAELADIENDNYSDIDAAAREEYVRTGSSGAMQSSENSKINKALAEQNASSIKEEKISDLIKELETAKNNVVYYWKNGAKLTGDEKKTLYNEYTNYKSIAKKLELLGQKIPNDNNGNSIDDDVDAMNIKITTSDVKITPDKIGSIDDAIKNWSDYSDSEKTAAREIILKNILDTSLNSEGELNSDIDIVKNNEKNLKELGFKIISYNQKTKANDNANAAKAATSNAQAFHDAVKNIIINAKSYDYYKTNNSYMSSMLDDLYNNINSSLSSKYPNDFETFQQKPNDYILKISKESLPKKTNKK